MGARERVQRSAIVIVLGAAALCLLLTATASARVLRVGKYKGIRGQFKSIQAAVNHAKPGDWILVAPGDYKEHRGLAPSGVSGTTGGVLITTPRLYIRGMNRNKVIVDGTKPHAPKCSAKESDQEFGPPGDNGAAPLGLNGILIYKARDVWVQNLTICNYLHGSGNTGNEIWWNGGDGSATVGGFGFVGSYLTTTSQFFKDETTAAQYGIFSSNWSGGTWDHTYGSNFNDSAYYIGACQQICNQTIDHAWGEWNSLGYSGSNSGGQLVIKNSEFDNNQDGFDTNSQNGDNPPPQNGACPNNGISPITHTHSCWVFMNNYVHDNNNPNVPTAGLAGGGPVGTGMSLSGARNDTVMNNRFVHNGAWGTIIVPFPDSGPPCTGGTNLSGQVCLYDPYGNAILHNTYTGNGFFGNPTNGDIALTNAEPGPTNCFAGNTDTSGNLKITPSNAEQTYPTCDGSTVAPSVLNPQSAQFLEEAACDSTLSLPGAGKSPCAPGDSYPRRQYIQMHPLPTGLQTMPNPCKGVPRNPWCPRHKSHKRHKHQSGASG